MTESATARAHVDLVARFSVTGWASSVSGRVDVRLRHHGVEVDTPIARFAREDVADVTGFDASEAGFTIDIPASIWESASPTESCELQVWCRGAAVGNVIEVKRLDVVRWVGEVARLTDPVERAYLLALGLDHVVASGVAERLDASTYALLADIARPRGVTLAQGGVSLRAAALAKATPRKPHWLDDDLLAEAMLDLNARLLAGEPVLAATEATQVVFPLSGPARAWFVNVVAQLGCQRDVLASVAGSPAFSRFAAAVSERDAFALSLAVAVLVHRGEHHEAARALETLVGATQEGGWVETFALRAAFEMLHDHARSGLASSADAARLRAEFVNLIAKLASTENVRMDDAQLIHIAASIVDARDNLADDERDVVIPALIHYFGLRPTFHTSLCSPATPQSARPPDLMLDPCCEAYASLTRELAKFAHEATASYALVDAIDWFVRRGVHRSELLLRAVTLEALARDSSAPTHLALLDRLRAHMPDAMVRIAAAPNLASTVLEGRTTPDSLAARLVGLARVPMSPTRSLERSCVAAMLAFEQRLDRGEAYDEAELNALMGTATLVSEARSHFLGVDVLAALYLRLASDVAARRVFARLRDAVERALADHDVGPLLPAPVWAAASRLSVVDADERSRALARTISARFGDAEVQTRARLGASRGFLFDVAHVRLETAEFSGARAFLAKLRWLVDTTDHRFFLLSDLDTRVSRHRDLDIARLRSHHAHGRTVTWRKPSDADRSDSARPLLGGRLELESGVWLSRLAVLRVLGATETVIGQRLVQSPMDAGELLLALLGASGIEASQSERVALDRVRPCAAARGSASSTYAFLPGPSSPTLFARLPSPKDDDVATKASTSLALFPKTVWPIDAPPATDATSHPLELVAGAALLGRVRELGVVVVSVVRNERVLMPHFLEHYRKLGVRCFIVVDNDSDDGTAAFLSEQPDVVLYATRASFKTARYGVVWQETVLANHCLGRWAIVADADEFLVYAESEHIPVADYLAKVEQSGADAVLLGMVDMYPFHDLTDADFAVTSPFESAPWFDKAPLRELVFGAGHFGNSRNFASALRHRIAPSRINAYVSQKVSIVRYHPLIRFCEGMHYVGNVRVHAEPAYFAHFKYHAGFAEKVAIEVARGEHYNDAEEYRRYHAMLLERRGGFGDAEISQRFESSASFSGLIGPPTP